MVYGVGVNTSLAYKCEPLIKDPNYSVEHHDVTTKAFDNKDYNTWKNIMQGKITEAQKIRQDLDYRMVLEKYR